MKSIKSFLIVVMAALILVASLMSTFIAYGFARSTSMGIIYENLQSLANSVSSYIASEIDTEMAVLNAITAGGAISSTTMSLEEKAAYLVDMRNLDHARLNYFVFDTEGNGVATDGTRVNVADREYFKRGMRGLSYVSEPLEDKTRPGELSFAFSVPIRNKDTGAIMGVLILNRDARDLTETLADIPIGQSGGPYIISNDTGDTVAHYRSFSQVMRNAQAVAGTNSSYKDLADFNARMRAGGEGIGQYSYEGTTYLAAYAQLPSEYCAWSVACLAPVSEFTGGINAMLTLMLGAALVLCAVGVFVAVIIARSIVKPILTIRDGLEGIAQGGGDLTVRLEEKGNNEIAAISSSFNKFIATLNSMMGNVSRSAGSMEEIGQALSGNAAEISSNVSSIVENIESLSFTAEEQSASVTETSSTITQIAHNIESLTGQIENQSAAVTESSAAVQQMVANIGSISDNVTKATGSFDELKQSANDGKGSINAVQELVSKLSAQSDSLLEANSVIDNIASQTNLLAMNAAIEAAHAGEAGKGFSVVAEEIRKLAENSASQSKTIAAGLKSTIASINNIAQATTTADSAFDAVATRISAITDLVSSINLAMSEQNAGGRQVLEALRDIEGITTNIRDGAVEMNTGTETILKEISRLSSVSQSVTDRSQSIAKAAEEINGTVAEIVLNTGKNKKTVDTLVDITGKFKL